MTTVATDVRSAAAYYVSQMLNLSPGVKALLLDDECARMIALVSTQTYLFNQNVYLTEKLGAPCTTPLTTLNALVFARPTAENVHKLRVELQNPAFGSYVLVFSNTVRPTYLEEIADADAQHRVLKVLEYYLDFYALDAHLFAMNASPCVDSMLGLASTLANPGFERTVDGIVASMLALRRRPTIRYLFSSSLCRNLAERVMVRMDQESDLFTFRSQGSPPLLLILDRCEDPVTPLLNQWTYEAMIHELIGLENNRVSLACASDIPDDLKEVVLDTTTDDFFKDNRYENFGELGVNLKKMVDDFHKQSNTSTTSASIEDMMRFVGNYPAFRKTMNNVSKHVAVSSELSRLVERNQLLHVSQLEQDMACREAENDHRRRVMECLGNSRMTNSDKIRLVMIYSLRYEQTPTIRKTLASMVGELRKAGVAEEGLHLISHLKQYAGAQKRSGDVFSNKSFFALASNTVRRGIGGVDNIYTQHEPLLVQTLDDLFRSRSRASTYPAVRLADSAEDSLLGSADKVNGGAMTNSIENSSAVVPPPRELLVVIAGGATLEESKCISAINGSYGAFRPPEGSVTASASASARQLGASVVLAGSNILNSTSFAVEITKHAMMASRAASYRGDRVY